MGGRNRCRGCNGAGRGWFADGCCAGFAAAVTDPAGIEHEYDYGQPHARIFTRALIYERVYSTYIYARISTGGRIAIVTGYVFAGTGDHATDRTAASSGYGPPAGTSRWPRWEQQ